MSEYAASTRVSINQTRHEIEYLLDDAGAEAFAFMKEGESAAIAFRLSGRNYVLKLHLPDRTEFAKTKTGRSRYASEAEKFYQQAIRARWRALLLLLKAKLIAVADGVTTVEDEFLAAAMLNDGQTVGQWAASHPTALTGSGPLLLPGGAD
jgi:hypothetical protein